jgi:hypothetical protein
VAEALRHVYQFQVGTHRMTADLLIKFTPSGEGYSDTL